jgi:hypothetical protein
VTGDIPAVGHGTAPLSEETGAVGFGVRISGIGLRPPTPNSVDPNGIPARGTDEGWPMPVGDEADAAGPPTGLLARPAQVPDAVPAMPPPSKTVLELDVPTIPEVPAFGMAVPKDACALELPMLEHDGLPPMEGTKGDAPLVIGLTPGDASSVAPRGIPVGATGAAGPIPSGDVMPSGDGPIPPTCARAAPQPNNVAAIAANTKRVIFASSSWELAVPPPQPRDLTPCPDAIRRRLLRARSCCNRGSQR